MSRLKQNRGFTLIEVMVVIVIMSVLMAIAVPSVMKYLGTGDEAKALDEAYACVSAGDYYGLRAYTNERYIHEISSDIIKKKAGVNGKINNFSYDENDYTILGLRYTSKSGIIVTFKNDEYLISKDEEWDIENLLAKLQYIDRQNDLSKYLTSGSPAKAAQELQRLYKEQNKNQYYPLSKEEKEHILANSRDNQYTGIESLIWKPVYASDGSIILCADDKDTTRSNVNTPMVYYKGSYYVHLYSYNGIVKPVITAKYVNEYGLIIKDDKPYDPDSPDKNKWTLVK